MRSLVGVESGDAGPDDWVTRSCDDDLRPGSGPSREFGEVLLCLVDANAAHARHHGHPDAPVQGRLSRSSVLRSA